MLVVDNAPCHTRAEEVFGERSFVGAELLRVGPYSPMLNPIENVFSAYKASFKRFLAHQRRVIMREPRDRTITEHRAAFVQIAAGPLLEGVVTTELCSCFFVTL